MSLYVIDASVVVPRLVKEVLTPYARAMFAHYQPSDRYIVPEHCLLECANVLASHVRFHGMPMVAAAQARKVLYRLPLTRVPAKRLLKRALDMSLRHQIVVYDSVYIAIAEQVGAPLITADQKQAQAAAAEGVTLKPITDFA
jgi:predicted nucleic acid-binding protein